LRLLFADCYGSKKVAREERCARFHGNVPGRTANVDTHTVGRWARQPVRASDERASHLHEFEKEGWSGATPLISIAEVGLFLLPVIVVVTGAGFAPYYLV
jgi:hypothetical protein